MALVNILSPVRLPFRHTGNSRCYSTYEFSRSLNLTLCQFLRWFTPVEPNQATFVSPALDKLMSAICTAKQRIREQAITASAQLDSLQLGARLPTKSELGQTTCGNPPRGCIWGARIG